jgi:hypothetical protein
LDVPGGHDGLQSDDQALGAGLKAATISIHKPGYIERNLGRDGNLPMSDEPPAEQVNGYRRVVLPGKPFEINFVLSRRDVRESDLGTLTLRRTSRPRATCGWWHLAA